MTGEDDRFPIEVGTEVLRRGRPEAEVVLQRNADAAIAEHLADIDIPWSEAGNALPADLPMILETPRGIDGASHRDELELLGRWRRGEPASAG